MTIWGRSRAHFSEIWKSNHPKQSEEPDGATPSSAYSEVWESSLLRGSSLVTEEGHNMT